MSSIKYNTTDDHGRCLKYETWFTQEVAKGREAAEAGNLISHQEVKARLADRGINVG